MGKRKQAPPPVVTKEQYDAMTPAERRVALAREAKMLVQAGFVTPSLAGYTDPTTWGVPLSDFLSRPECEVCARGLLVIALARIANDCAARGWDTPHDLYVTAAADYSDRRPVEAFPDAEVWVAIEEAFELWGYFPPEFERLEPEGRLLTICDTIISTNGEANAETLRCIGAS